jgi:cobalt-zinc-cadmium efflux system protein
MASQPASLAPVKRPGHLRLALTLTVGVAVIELAGGMLAHSLALLSDAAHVSMDVVALAIALAADIQAARPATSRQTFGFARVEALAALANGGLLFGITVLIAVEAVRRFAHPELPSGTLMFAVAATGMAVNVFVGVMISSRAGEDLNVKAALYHVSGDAIGAFAVMVGGVVILLTRQAWIDPALSLLVAAIIVAGVVRVVREAADILLESAPAHAATEDVAASIRSCRGVVGVHDLHVWTIGGGMHVLSAHVHLADARISEASAILRRIEENVRSGFGISHVTIQFECESCADDERIVCTQPPARSAPPAL